MEEGVEEHRKDVDSLLLKESMVMLGCTAIVRVLSPVTLSLEVHWDEVSELSVAATGKVKQRSNKGRGFDKCLHFISVFFFVLM